MRQLLVKKITQIISVNSVGYLAGWLVLVFRKHHAMLELISAIAQSQYTIAIRYVQIANLSVVLSLSFTL